MKNLATLHLQPFTEPFLTFIYQEIFYQDIVGQGSEKELLEYHLIFNITIIILNNVGINWNNIIF